MNKKITINNTDKAGWIRISTNDCFPSMVSKKEINFKISSVLSVNKNSINGTDCVEIITDKDIYNLINTVVVDSASLYTVASVNLVAPKSIDDLKDKILSLL